MQPHRYITPKGGGVNLAWDRSRGFDNSSFPCSSISISEKFIIRMVGAIRYDHKHLATLASYSSSALFVAEIPGGLGGLEKGGKA